MKYLRGRINLHNVLSSTTNTINVNTNDSSFLSVSKSVYFNVLIHLTVGLRYVILHDNDIKTK